MKIHFAAFAVATILLVSCKSFQVVETKTLANTPDIGVEWQSSGILDDALRNGTDSVINAFITEWNSNNSNSFRLHPKQRKDKDYVSLDLRRGKMVGTGGKVLGYSLTTLGLTLVPYALVAAETGYIAAFAYMPEHAVQFNGSLSPTLAATRKSEGPIAGSAGALFQSNSRAKEKIYLRLHSSLHKAFQNMHKQLESNSRP